MELMEKCKSFKYFYNNYCKRDSMPEYSEEVFQDYLKMAEENRYGVSRTRKGNNLYMQPLRPNECYEK